MTETHGPKKIKDICTWIVTHPKTSIFICLAILFAFAPGLVKFQEKNDVRIWFRETDPKIKILDQFERQFGNEESIIVSLHSPNGIFDKESIFELIKLTDKMWQVPAIQRVDSLANHNWIYSEEDEIIIEPFLPELGDPIEEDFLRQRKEEALKDKTIPGYLLSKNANTAMIIARITTTLDGSPNYQKIVEKTREILKEFQGISDHKFMITGDAAVNDSFREVSNADGAKIIPLLFALIVGYLFYIFRSFKATFLPLIITGMTILTVMGLEFYLGIAFNSVLSILPAILIAICMADSVHVIVTFYQFLGSGDDQEKAAIHALEKNFIPTLLTSLSTMIGFFSLLFTELMPIRELGLLSGIGCGLAWVFSMLFLGGIFNLVKLRAPKRFHSDNSGVVTPMSLKFSKMISSYQILILILFGGFSIGGIYLATKVNINSNPYTYFKKHVPIRMAFDFVKEEFGGNSGPELMIDSGGPDNIKDPNFLAKVEKFKNWLDNQPHVIKTVDIVNILKKMHKSLNEDKEEFYNIPNNKKTVAELLLLYTMSIPQGAGINDRVNITNDMIRMSVIWNVVDTNTFLQKVNELEEKAREFGLNIKVTGKYYLFQRMMEYVVKTFLQSVASALFLVAILMMILFQSVSLGLLSLIPNVIPLILGGAIMKVFGMDLNIGTALVASVCLGIAVDDTIHFLSNYNRLRKKGMERMEVIAHVFNYTGKALIITSLVLCSGFGLYTFGDFIPNVYFGILSAFVLGLALIIDLIFLPALLLFFGRFRSK